MKKKIFSNKFLQVAISPLAENSMILTAPYSEVSPAIYNLFFIRVSPIYREHIQKKFSKKILGFYSHFKKGTLMLPYGNHRRKWVKIKVFVKVGTDDEINEKDAAISSNFFLLNIFWGSI